MQSTHPCRRCLPDTLPDERSLHENIRERVRLLPDDERAGEAEYARRLALCGQCDQLIRGTCMQCGCYVELRAARRGMRCAHPEPKW